jgi:endonuclease YncB( thermonuclease family)
MRHLILLLLAFIATIITLTAQQGPTFTPFTVVSVHDGDTWVAKDESEKTVTIRPIGYDAPEVRSNIILETQPYGRIAGDSLRSMIKGKKILLDTTALKLKSQRDIYGRLLAEPYFADSSSISLYMIKRGLAWYSYTSNRRFPKMNTILKDAHRSAREENKGLWVGYLDTKGKKRYPEAPWTWRKKFSLRE